MKNRWDVEVAAKITNPVSLRAYSSRLLGADPNLVLHGGGNTSVKGGATDVFGEFRRALFVKGSGWDLKSIEEAGFPATDLDYLLRLGQLSTLSDSEMMKQLRLSLLDPSGPTPSVEAILHALIPHTFVDHTHADAVVTISNSPRGAEILQSIYGDEVLVLPYLMPGFVLAKQVAEATATIDWQGLRGIVLLNHGIFTFDEDAKASYDTMIELVSRAEDYLSSSVPESAVAQTRRLPEMADAVCLSELRRKAGNLLGQPCLIRLDSSEKSVGFACRHDCGELATSGPLTPDHTIHAKAFAANFGDDLLAGLDSFAADYRAYFDQFSNLEHQCLDLMPRYGVWKNKGMLYFAANSKKLKVVQDITEHTIEAIQLAEGLGGWRALPREKLFEVEYWELEQAKLRTTAAGLPFQGRVAVVTGAGSGIGRACVERLLADGCVVVGLDVDKNFASSSTDSFLALNCDVTDVGAVSSALLKAVSEFGGIDLVVSNAGSFPSSCFLEAMVDEDWEQSLNLNLSAHMRLLRACVPFLKNGFEPSVAIIGSKNVPAPGPGAAAYSVAKAGLAQLARLAALELGEYGIRVNTVHPNGVFDTAIWSAEVLAQRAAHYGTSVEQYKANNVLQTEVTSKDVAAAVTQLLGGNFAKTTGAVLPVDGGNDRVI